ncbi:hypothetical protein [Tenacibaculum sp. 190524A02b]|uniref:hypothetical protein n=1 Tax=Tenacibaculum vairaonense TaxID=3137860 RepID=UPI0031FB09EA
MMSIVKKEIMLNPTGGFKPSDGGKETSCGCGCGGLHGDMQQKQGGSFWSGLTLKGILEMAGTTYSQIVQAKNGNPVYVQNPQTGQTQDIGPVLVSKIEQQAKLQQTSMDNMMKMMQMQMMQQQQNNNNKPQQSNMKYVLIGGGVLALVAVMYLMNNNKKQ